MNKLKIAFASILISSPALVMARSAGKIAEDLGGQASTATTAAILIAALLGIIFLIMGGMGFKKYADNPQQNPISKPIIFLAAGALLFGLSATSDTMSTTIFGDGAETIGIDGSAGGFD